MTERWASLLKSGYKKTVVPALSAISAHSPCVKMIAMQGSFVETSSGWLEAFPNPVSDLGSRASAIWALRPRQSQWTYLIRAPKEALNRNHSANLLLDSASLRKMFIVSRHWFGGCLFKCQLKVSSPFLFVSLIFSTWGWIASWFHLFEQVLPAAHRLLTSPWRVIEEKCVLCMFWLWSPWTFGKDIPPTEKLTTAWNVDNSS